MSNTSPEVYEHKTLNYKGKTIFSKIVMGDFNRILKFFQEDEACFMFIDNGSFLMRTPKETIHFESGDGMLAKCGNYFFENQLKEETSDMRTTLVAAYFYPSIIKEIFEEDIHAPIYRTDYDSNKIKIDKLLSHFRDNLVFLLDNPEIVDPALILTKLKEFLILLAKTEKAPGVIDFIASLFKPVEYNFKSIVEQNIFSSLSLEEFAMLCNMSLATFKRKFESYYDESPRKYISRQKMKKAALMLSFKENSIADIAYDCGFESLSTFNRNFKNFHRKSPSEYKKAFNEPK